MRKLAVLTAFILLAVPQAWAQDGYTHLFARGGAVYRKAAMFALGLDFAARYHASYEIGLAYYRDTDRYGNYLIGINYKPVIARAKNTVGKFRIGAYAGTDLDGFVAAPNLGLELMQSLSGTLDLVLSNNNGYYFFARGQGRWRLSGEIGFRFSL